MDIEAGTIVANRYRVLRPLGRGGMGEVLAAENTRTGRTVAIKVLHADAKAKHSAVERFKREARAAGSINSDYVTQVLDVEEDATHGIVLVFELLEGESLIDRLKRTGPIPFEELYYIIEKVWMGLADAHRVGIIHRDLKPSNVFLEQRPDGTTRVKILDFGISKLPKEMEGETLTEMGQSLGTFSFMPPEQIGKAKLVDHRADIYATTTMIYQSLTGQLPYVAKNVLVMVELKSKEPPRKVADALDGIVDPRLEAFVAKGLARDVNQRFQSAMEALAAWRELAPVSSGQTSQNPQSAIATPVSWPQAPTAPARSLSPSGVRGPIPPEQPTRHEASPSRQTPFEMEPTSDDSAATLAMPVARLMPGLAKGAGPSWPPLSDARPTSGTVMMTPPMGASPSRPPASYGADLRGSGAYAAAQAPASPVASTPSAQPGYASMPQGSMSHQGYAQHAPNMAAPPNAWQKQTGPYQAAEAIQQARSGHSLKFYVITILMCTLLGAGVVTALIMLSGQR